MNGLILMGVATLVFLFTGTVMLAATLGAFRYVGHAFNRNRTAGGRAAYAVLALACFLGIFVAAAAGFAGITSLVFEAAIQDDI